MSRTAALVTRHPRRVIAVGILLAVIFAVLGSGVSSRLKAGGYDDPKAASQRGAAALVHDFGVKQTAAVFLVTARDGNVDSRAVAAAGRSLTTRLEGEPGVTVLASYWSATGRTAASLRSQDGRSALISVSLAGSEDEHDTMIRTLDKTYDTAASAAGPVRVAIGGEAQGDSDTDAQIKGDLAKAEGIAIPLTAILLILVFGSVVSGLLPLVVAGSAIVGTLASLFLLTQVTDVSVYALNLTTAMGIGLGLDYALLIVSRYREELSRGRERVDAIATTLRTAGRTIAFSAATVGVSLAALLIFPLYFLRSFAYAAAAVVVISAVSALVLLPAVLMLLGDRINAFSVPWRRGARANGSGESAAWARLAKLVMRRPLVLATPVVALLLFAGTPFLHIQVGRPDDRVLPTTTQARQVGDVLRSQFPVAGGATLQAVLPDAPMSLVPYAEAVSRVPGVADVVSPAATFVGGKAVAAGVASQRRGDAAYLSILPDANVNSTDLVHAIRAVPAPATTLLAGQSAEQVDSVASVTDNLPLALGLIAVATFVLLFLFTGSVVLPLKALLLNVISLSAVMGVLVFVFQDGHFSSLLDFTPTPLAVAMPVLMFCIAFGLSMDYEVFLLGRIAEQHHAGADTVTAVSTGLARTGRIVTTAAAVLSLTFFSFVSSRVSFIQLFGLGTGIAIVIDATLVRGILVPAAMRLMGAANWWAPAPLRRLHNRIGVSEGTDSPDNYAPVADDHGVVTVLQSV